MALTKLPKLKSLNVTSRRYRTSPHSDSHKEQQKKQQSEVRFLPFVDDAHLELIGRHCPEMEDLNISHNDVSIGKEDTEGGHFYG